ncbi:MAG: hypothetical protein ACM3QZ_03170 [Solirubrobacterales bacterium]
MMRNHGVFQESAQGTEGGVKDMEEQQISIEWFLVICMAVLLIGHFAIR